MTNFVFDGVENTVGKVQNASSFYRLLKVRNWLFLSILGEDECAGILVLQV